MNHKKRIRYHFLDGIRGIVLLSMIAYHFSWNMVYLYGKKWDWYHGREAYLWQQSICWIFIILSGFCWSMGKYAWKRGIIVFCCGLLVTVATTIVMPHNRVVFGVLTCIGSCMLFMSCLHEYLKKIWPEVGIVVHAALFVLTRNINAGYLGFESWNFLQLPKSWYRNLLTAYIGMPASDFYSTDYFSFFPWWFLFATGYFLYRFCQKYELLQANIWKKKIPFVDFLGKHSLAVYLLHQPIIYVAQQLLIERF